MGFHDITGFFQGPKDSHVKTYASLYAEAKAALEAWAAEVRGGVFPLEEHTVGMDEEELARFQASLLTSA